MRMNTSWVVALVAGLAVSCFAGERNAPQRQVKSADTTATAELDYSSIVLDEDTTVTIVSEADGSIFDVQVLQTDGAEAVTVSMLAEQALTQVRKAPVSIDTGLQYQSLLVDDGLTATMISDAQGNLIGATVSSFDGGVVTTSSTSDNNVIMATKDLRIISVGDVAVAIRLDETTGLWDAGAIIDMPLAVTDVATDGTGGNTPDAVTCTVGIAVAKDCTVFIAHSCGGNLTVFVLCRDENGSHCQGKWHECGAIVLH